MNSNSVSTSSSGTLPSNTISNPRRDLKAITTRSGVSYEGPQILPPPSFLPKVGENKPEATKDTVTPPNNGSIEDVQPPVVQTETPVIQISKLVSEPVIAPVSALKPNTKSSIPYPSRRNDERNYFDADPRVPLILGRSFLKTGRALIDVFEGELTLRVGNEAITINLDQTSRYSANYNDMTAKRIDVIDMSCEEYSQEVLSFSDVIASGNPTPYYDPIVSITSPTLTPFRNSDFLLEEVDAFLALEDDPTSSEVNQSYPDSKGDILLLEAFLSDDPSLTPPNQGNYLPEVHKELKICEAKYDKSSIDKPPEVKLKDLPPHLKYAFLEGDDKLPVIIAKYLSMEEKTTLITVLKSHKRAIAWKLSDIKGIDPEFCTYKILIEDDFEPARCMMAIFYDMVEKTMEVFMDDFLVFGNSFQSRLSYLEKMLKSFLGHAGFYRRFIKDFSKIARPMTRLLEKDTPFIFSKECVEAFQTLKRMLTEVPILIAPDWDMPFKLMCDASDFAIGAVLGQRQEKHFKPIHYVGNKMHKAFLLLVRKFPLPEGTSHCLKKNATARRKVLPLPEVCTAIIVKEKPSVKDDSFL
nr:reverse transcriptase domain-containing protein [Tanacetum cinerariifolium]